TKTDEVLQEAEVMPVFPGGMEALVVYVGENLKYPVEAKKKGTEGMVLVSFVVSNDGGVRDVKAIKGIGDGCDKEAVRVVNKMPKWDPGMVEGKPVAVQYNLPVKFTLSTEE
ncbi:MAG: energy transducer TonB, partial [Bacteroidetes bacterium]|nr:energy transducer TonB [Bacteroidota bacterium]